jgi:hypothetical protein
MSAAGHSPTCRLVMAMPALPPKTDIHCDSRIVRSVPQADITCTNYDFAVCGIRLTTRIVPPHLGHLVPASATASPTV